VVARKLTGWPTSHHKSKMSRGLHGSVNLSKVLPRSENPAAGMKVLFLFHLHCWRSVFTNKHVDLQLKMILWGWKSF